MPLVMNVCWEQLEAFLDRLGEWKAQAAECNRLRLVVESLEAMLGRSSHYPQHIITDVRQLYDDRERLRAEVSRLETACERMRDLDRRLAKVTAERDEVVRADGEDGWAATVLRLVAEIRDLKERITSKEAERDRLRGLVQAVADAFAMSLDTPAEVAAATRQHRIAIHACAVEVAR